MLSRSRTGPSRVRRWKRSFGMKNKKRGDPSILSRIPSSEEKEEVAVDRGIHRFVLLSHSSAAPRLLCFLFSPLLLCTPRLAPSLFSLPLSRLLFLDHRISDKVRGRQRAAAIDRRPLLARNFT